MEINALIIKYVFPKHESSNDNEIMAEIDNLKNFFNPVFLIFFIYDNVFLKESIEFYRKNNELENESLLDQFVEDKITKELKSNFIYLPFIYRALYNPMLDINNFLLKILPKSFDVTYVLFNKFNYKITLIRLAILKQL